MRIAVVVAGIVISLAAIAWFLRDDLIRRLSTPLLEDYGITVVDVSLDALATGDATISHLKLIHEEGTTIVIDDLTLPYAATSERSKTFHARKVAVITATRTDGEAFELAELIRQFLSLPANLAESVVVVDELSLAPYPAVRNVRWEITDRQQRLDGAVDSVAMSVTQTRNESGNHDFVFSILSAAPPKGGNTFNASLLDEEAGLMLNGTGPIDLRTWNPLARLAGIVPAQLEVVSGTASLALDIAIPDDAAQTPTLSVSLTPNTVLEFEYGPTSGSTATVLVRSASSTDVSANFPDGDWSLELAEASLTVSYGEWNDIPLSLTDVTCKSGPVCSLDTYTTISERQLPIGDVTLAEVSSTEQLHFTDAGVRIDVQPGATLRLNDLRTAAGVGLKRMQAKLVSTATLELVDAGWRLLADSLDTQIEHFILSDDAAVSMPLFLENVVADAKNDEVSLRSGLYAPSSRAVWDEKTLVLPGFKGSVWLRDTEAAADLQTVGLREEASIKLRHDLASGAGRVNVDHGTVSFAGMSLSDRVAPWPGDRDIVAGELSFDFLVNWEEKESRLAFNAQAFVAATKLAGYYGDTAFAGLSTELNASYQEDVGFSTEPSTITAALVEVGVPVENLSANYALDLDALSADVDGLRMTAFGGLITADPFSFHTVRPVNTLTLNAESLDLSELLSLKEFDAIHVTGSIGARLPLSIQADKVMIESGTLTGNPPGGVIRYAADGPSSETEASSLGFAKRVLSNFEFDTLTSDVDLSREGDLILKLQLKGRNPDLDEKRPVVLNLGVENNIPQMLRSLRAARAVEDVLERRLGR